MSTSSSGLGWTTFCSKRRPMFEVVMFTASLGKYADGVLNEIDKLGSVSARLYRESCVLHNGAYVKDLSRMGRSLDRTLLVDNSALSYSFQPANGLASATFLDDCSDIGLLSILDVLVHLNKVGWGRAEWPARRV